MRGDGPVVETLAEVAQQIADPHAGRSGIARADAPDQRRLVRRIADRQHLHVELLISRRGDHAKNDRVRIDLRIGPGEIDLILALHQRHNPLLLDQRGIRIIELNFDALAHRQRDQLDPAEKPPSANSPSQSRECSTPPFESFACQAPVVRLMVLHPTSLLTRRDAGSFKDDFIVADRVRPKRSAVRTL